MKIQSLAVIFIIIILPISMVLNEYTKSQMKTLELQISYDSRLKNATYDAIKAFQLNTVNSNTSDLANSKIRDIEASANTFFNSVAKNFNMEGYNSDVLKEYVPALVYTMYDGYYIYSPFTNTLDATKNNNYIEDDGTTTLKSDAELLNSDEYTYYEGQKVSSLKPYIYYSCHYKKGSDDFVITYSLDNYITIEGVIGGEDVYDSGYLLSDVSYNGDINNPTNATYRGINIEQESSLMEENIGYNQPYKYIKLNGVKYYHDTTEDKWFSILNSERYNQDKLPDAKNDGAVRYYAEATEFTKKCRDKYKLGELKNTHIVDEQYKANSTIGADYIFDFNNSDGIESPDSNFNQHRLAVIRTSIERNLSIAIANYNNYSGVQANFQMPKLKEDEWDKIINNVSLISFLQGLSIGGKIYNGYAIITNNKNEEVVSEESIYIVSNGTGEYHRVNDNDLLTSKIPLIGVLNVDFEINSRVLDTGMEYFYPRNELASYSSIVSQNNVNQINNVYEYLKSDNEEVKRLAKVYYTALGRERYGMYRTANSPEKIKARYK